MTGTIIGILAAVIIAVFLAKLALRRAGRTKVVVNITMPPFPPPQVMPPFTHQTMPSAQEMPPFVPQTLPAPQEMPRTEAQAFDDIVRREFYER